MCMACVLQCEKEELVMRKYFQAARTSRIDMVSPREHWASNQKATRWWIKKKQQQANDTNIICTSIKCTSYEKLCGFIFAGCARSSNHLFKRTQKFDDGSKNEIKKGRVRVNDCVWERERSKTENMLACEARIKYKNQLKRMGKQTSARSRLSEIYTWLNFNVNFLKSMNFCHEFRCECVCFFLLLDVVL